MFRNIYKNGQYEENDDMQIDYSTKSVNIAQ